MKIVFMKEQRTLMVRDDKGNSMHTGGDDKVICNDMNAAYTVVQVISQLTGHMFFESDKDDFVIWESPGANFT